MRRRFGLLVASAAALLLQAGTLNAAELKVVVTIKPLHSLASAVMEGVAEPRLLVDGAKSPHTYSLKPSDARALNQADVVIRVSEALEPFLSRMLNALPRRVKVLSLAEAPGLTLHKQRRGGTFEEHRRESGDQVHVDEHGQDPHVWLDPSNAKIIARYIADALAARAPEHAKRLKNNAAALAIKLDELSAELKGTLEPLAGRRYLVFHDAYQYLERRYGLEPVGSVTVSPDLMPSAKRLTALRHKIVAYAATCVFAEPQFEPRLMATVTEGTNVRAATLDPLGAQIQAGPNLYFTLMRGLASDLARCLSVS